MKKRLNKKAYFFLIDSILALGVLAIGGFLVFAFYLKVPSGNEPSILSEDVMDFFANNKMKEINNAYAGLGGVLWETEGLPGGLCPGEELIANPENTLLQQIAEFYAKSQGPMGNPCYFNLLNANPNEPEDLAEKFIEQLTQGTFPPQYAFEFWMNDALLYPATEQIDAKNNAKVLIPSKRIVYGIRNQETGDMLGPYDAEVFVWQ